MSKKFLTNPLGKRKAKAAKGVDNGPEAVATSTTESQAPAITPPADHQQAQDSANQSATPETDSAGAAKMEQTLTLTKSTNPIKSKRIVLFGGPLKTVQFLATAFPKGTDGAPIVPDTITVTGNFAEPHVPKAKETPEERKARLAALPKLTPAEKLAKAKERLAKLEAKVAKEQAASGATA